MLTRGCLSSFNGLMMGRNEQMTRLILITIIALLYIFPQNAYSFSLDSRHHKQASLRYSTLVPEGIINNNPVIVRGTGQKLFVIQVNGTAEGDKEVSFAVTVTQPSNLTKENFRVILSSDPAVSEEDLRRFPLVVSFNSDGEYETSVVFTYTPYYPRPLLFVVVESQLPPGVEGKIIFSFKVDEYVDYGDFESVIFPILIIFGLLVVLVMLSACFWGMVKRMRDRARIVSEQMEMEAKTLIELNRQHQQRTPIANHVHVRQERDNQVLNAIDPQVKHDDSENMRPEGIVVKQLPVKSQEVELKSDNDAVTYVRLDRPPVQEEIQVAHQPIPPHYEESNNHPIVNPYDEKNNHPTINDSSIINPIINPYDENPITNDNQEFINIPPPIFNPSPVPGYPGLYATTTTTTTVILPKSTEIAASNSNDH